MAGLGLLGAAYSSDTSEESEEEDEEHDEEKQKDKSDMNTKDGVHTPLANPFLAKSSGSWLPKPSFMQETETVKGVKYDNSVFSNPFRDKEDQKSAILEQHVEMTQNQKNKKTIDGKKVCWMYRKGRCRHGHRCSFAHDSDIQSSMAEKLYTPKYDKESQISSDKMTSGLVAPLQTGDDTMNNDALEEAPRKKWRPGLSNGLEPSKKAMRFHNEVYNK